MVSLWGCKEYASSRRPPGLHRYRIASFCLFSFKKLLACRNCLYQLGATWILLTSGADCVASLKGSLRPRGDMNASKNIFSGLWSLLILNDARFPHILSSDWTMDFRCHFCKRQIFFCKAPDMLQYFCFKAVLLHAHTIADWVQRFDVTIDSISSVLAKRNH